MAIRNDKGGLISFDCSDILQDVSEDILQFGKRRTVYAACKERGGVKIIVDYFFDPPAENELREGEWAEKMSFAQLITYLTRLNNLNNDYNDIGELYLATGWTIKQFSEYFEIPGRTVQDWLYGKRSCPTYLLTLMNYKLNAEQII